MVVAEEIEHVFQLVEVCWAEYLMVTELKSRKCGHEENPYVTGC